MNFNYHHHKELVSSTTFGSAVAEDKKWIEQIKDVMCAKMVKTFFNYCKERPDISNELMLGYPVIEEIKEGEGRIEAIVVKAEILRKEIAGWN